MKVASYKGGICGEGRGDVLSCCLCGEMDYDCLVVHRLGIAVGMAGTDYTFCYDCWYGPNLGKRLLALLDYPHGLYLRDDAVIIKEVSDER